MDSTVLLLVLGLAAAAYAQIEIPRYVAGRSGIVATRGILIVVGLAFGFVAANTFAEAAPRWSTFLAGFGSVHIPAALILLIKRARHSPKT
jgi:hypothetical protein